MNFRCGWVDSNTFLGGSHNCNLKEDEDNIYWKAIHKYSLKERLKPYIGMLLYGEIFGPGIQKNFDYGKKEFELVIFDLTINGNYINYDDVQFVVKDLLSLPTPPLLYKGEWKPELLKLADGKSQISNKHIKEGTVIRPVIERYDGTLGRVILKHISEKYLLKDYGDMH